MRTLIASTLIALLGFSSMGQSTEVAYVNGKFINSDGTFFSGIYAEYEDGVMVSQLTVNNGLLNGNAVYYFASGAIRIQGSYRFGQRDGKWVEFNNLGQLATISYYNNGQKDGKWEIWDLDGNKRFEMYYNNGEKVGTWKMWNDQGQLTTKEYGQ